MKQKIMIVVTAVALSVGGVIISNTAKGVKSITCPGAHACSSALDVCHLTDCSVWGGWTELP